MSDLLLGLLLGLLLAGDMLALWWLCRPCRPAALNAEELWGLTVTQNLREQQSYSVSYGWEGDGDATE